METSLTYREILLREFEQRCNRNPRYSQASFARDLKVSPSLLSEVLRGRHGLSRQRASALCERLGFGPMETERFCNLVDREHARSGVSRKIAEQKLKIPNKDSEHFQLRQDAFDMIAEWYHLPLLELITIDGDSGTTARWARRLGIAKAQAEAGLQRLVRLGLATKRGDKYRVARNKTIVPGGVPSAAVRRFHRQYLEKALVALESQAIDTREFQTVVLSVNKSKLPSLKQKLTELRREFCDAVRQDQDHDAVYAISLQFFSLTMEE